MPHSQYASTLAAGQQAHQRFRAAFMEIIRPTWASYESESSTACVPFHDITNIPLPRNVEVYPELGETSVSEPSVLPSEGSEVPRLPAPSPAMLPTSQAVSAMPCSSPSVMCSSPSMLHVDSQNTDMSASDRPCTRSNSGLTFNYIPPPSLATTCSALEDIDTLLHPPRKNGIGTKPFSSDDYLQTRMTMMQSLLWVYSRMNRPGWIKASEQVAHTNRGGASLAKTLRSWCQAFIVDRHDLPTNPYGGWKCSMLKNNEELAEEIKAHLQSVGKYVCAADIVHYMARSDVQERLGLTKGVGLSTVHEWMRSLEYRWMRTPRGQFIDGHEREDVVTYCQEVFLPEMFKWLDSCRQWNPDGSEEVRAHVDGFRTMVAWYGDQSIFTANDRRDMRWVQASEMPRPRPKGEGASLMVGDFISADYGFLRSKDGTMSAQRLFKPGKNHDGYFQSPDVLDQLTSAMDILDRDYPDEDHVFIIDNATTHLKRADDALSARKMPKFPSTNFGVLANMIGPNGKVLHGPDGKIMKHKIRMADARFRDGQPQSLYFPEGHSQAGAFKGMAEILKEHGYQGIDGLRAECPKFQCPPGVTKCCCRRLLYSEPDFRDVESLAQLHCKKRGYTVIFLPRFHCELNPIEQCWGYAKRKYREYPPSSLEADLERNVSTAMDTITVLLIRR